MGTATGAEERAPRGGRAKFLIGGGLIVAAIIYLIASSTQAAAQYYLTVDEVAARGNEMLGRDLKVAGAVIGDSIAYEADTLTLRFTIVNVPGDMDEIERAGGLAEALHRAVSDPNARHLQVVYVGPMPDLLRDEAQAIMTGSIQADGVFHADELLLKCPTRYEEAVPEQAAST